MELVKNKKTETSINEDKIKNFLYRKEICEHYNERLSFGLSVYNERLNEIKDSAKAIDKVEALELSDKIKSLSVEHHNNILSYNYIKKRIEELSDGKFDETQFKNLREEAAELAESELYVESMFLPANIELPKMIEVYQKDIELKENLLEHISSKDEKTPKDMVDIFELQMSLISLRRVLADRIDNYQNVFLPSYNEDMRLRELYFDKYMSYAKAFASIGKDYVMKSLLDQYKNNSQDKQYDWQFWKVLRERVDETINVLRDNKSKIDKKLLPYTKSIIK